MRRSVVLRQAVTARRAVVVPGCHDALSAKVIDAAGFEAVQVSGLGLAASRHGKPDVGVVPIGDVLDATWSIVEAVGIPVMADVDTGGGSALAAAWVTERLIAMGTAGMNIEDQVFPKRCGHMEGKDVIAVEEMAGKVRACADVRDRLDSAFVINARTDAFASHGLEEAIDRCRAYHQAGADLVFIDGIGTRADIERAVDALDVPLSLNLMDAVSGVKTELVPVPELAALGVGRVSIPVASTMVAHRALTEFFAALRDSPTGLLAGQQQWLSPFDDLNRFLGLAEYEALDDRYRRA